jgi:hemolysin activation/secretion protein
VTPELRPGAEPGTVDIDLNVKDTFPLHGSIELNNRYSANTSPLRLNASLSYNNLWQLGHSIGASFQTSPEDFSEVKVFSGFYIARFPAWGNFSLLAQATKQDSNVATLGSVAVAGRGETAGLRGIWTLPSGKDFYHSLSAGFDYKHFMQSVALGATDPNAPATDSNAAIIETPLTYFPLSAVYTATWAPKGAVTELNVGLTAGLRGLGSGAVEFENNRFRAGGNFIALRGDLSHTHDLPFGFEVFGKVQGQISNAPLVSSEQFGGGGLGTARGYLEAEALGENAVFGTLEFRSPSLLAWLPEKWKGNDWRVYAFTDAGRLTLHSPLPEQEDTFTLASYGVGTRIRLLDHLNGSLDAGIPLLNLTETRANDLRLTFRVWGDF